MVERKEPSSERPKISSLGELWATEMLLEALILNSTKDFPEFTDDPLDSQIWTAVNFMNDEIRKREQQGCIFAEGFEEQCQVINDIVEQDERLSVELLKQRLPSLAVLITRIHARLRAEKWFGNRKK